MKKILDLLRRLLSPLRRSASTTRRTNDAWCSFCRKNYSECGPLVEGPGKDPGGVYICGSCVDLCRSILDQESQRRQQVDAEEKVEQE